MSIISEIIAAAILCIAVFGIVCAVRQFAVLPVRADKNLKIYTVVTVSGGAENLQQALRGLGLLKSEGRVETELFVADAGLDDDGLKRTVMLLKDNRQISFCRAQELGEILGEGTWKTAETTYK